MVSLRKATCRALVVGALGLLATTLPAAIAPNDASASVSIAVDFDMLVKDADVVAVITPGEQSSVWEDGRIYTYTKIKVDQGVAGELGAGAEVWVRTMGGVVGKIGQAVDGEPVFVKEKPSLLFMRHFKAGGLYEISARAQGQYPITIDEKSKKRRLMRSTAVGMLFPPKPRIAESAPLTSGISPQSASSGAVQPEVKIRLAQDVLHDKPLDEMVREIASAWKRHHPSPAPPK